MVEVTYNGSHGEECSYDTLAGVEGGDDAIFTWSMLYHTNSRSVTEDTTVYHAKLAYASSSCLDEMVLARKYRQGNHCELTCTKS